MPATGEEQEEEEDEATAADDEFIDDAEVDQQANFRDMEDLPQQFSRQVGVAAMEEAEDDPKQKNKERQEPRALLPSTERATYADLADEPGGENYMFLLSSIANKALPYTLLLQTNAVAAENNEYLLPQHIEHLQSASMRQHARWFSIRPALPSLALGGEQQHQELRQLFRMVPQGEEDELHRQKNKKNSWRGVRKKNGKALH